MRPHRFASLTLVFVAGASSALGQAALPETLFGLLPQAHTYVIGLSTYSFGGNSPGTSLILETTAELWYAPESSTPVQWIKFADPSALGLAMPLESLASETTASTNGSLSYIYTGGVFGPTLYRYTLNPPELDSLALATNDLPVGITSSTSNTSLYVSWGASDGGGITYYPNLLSSPASYTVATSGPGALPNGGALAVGASGRLYALDATRSEILSYNAATGAYLGEFSVASGLSSTAFVSGEGDVLFAGNFTTGDGYAYNGLTGQEVGTFSVETATDPLSNGGKPSMTVDGNTLYVTSGFGRDIDSVDISAVPEADAWGIATGLAALAAVGVRTRSRRARAAG